ncbi:hypothetical protein [Falsiroseomonas selenitidurans]|uniref:Lipoprotein n=1 Tax=Falsiroseomonas selenitidurans TaxID=2716335 RepID=A0ABX1E757_9PROT|nr:hypothetical protein [Falsiroseomonas selenitidurans]NKC33044.1 hypothetical protein [Falsiroseomonas selenitidurans]
MRHAILWAGLLCLAGCAVPAGPTADIAPAPGDRGLAKDATEAAARAASSPERARLDSLPMALGQVPRISLEEDRTPNVLSGGIAVYRGGGFAITIYLFRRSAEPVPAGADSLPVLSELMGASSAARSQAAGVFGPRESSRLVRIQTRPPWPVVLCSQDSYPRGDSAVHDFTCVTALEGSLLKLRATFGTPAGEHERAQRAMGGILALVQRHLAGVPPMPPATIRS